MEISCESCIGAALDIYRSNLQIALSHALIFSGQMIGCCSGSHCTFAPSWWLRQLPANLCPGLIQEGRYTMRTFCDATCQKQEYPQILQVQATVHSTENLSDLPFFHCKQTEIQSALPFEYACASLLKTTLSTLANGHKSWCVAWKVCHGMSIPSHTPSDIFYA